MNVNLYDADKLREIFTQYLVEKSLRKTTERFTILDQICQIQGHFDVEMLRLRLDDNNFRVSRASIYNTIEVLMDAHLLIRHQFSSQIVQYELRNAAVTHHHLICNYCGAIKEIKSDRFVKEIANVKMTKFTPEYYSIYIYGICSKCKFRLKNKK